ncbi:hypothetical protein AAC387_Pa03g0943 [Persea americana]
MTELPFPSLGRRGQRSPFPQQNRHPAPIPLPQADTERARDASRDEVKREKKNPKSFDDSEDFKGLMLKCFSQMDEHPYSAEICE